MTKNKIFLISLIVVVLIALGLYMFLNSNEKYTINYDTDGGNILSSFKISKNGKILKPKDPVKEGYIFLGWYSDGKKFDFDTKITKNITLEAKWQKIEQDQEETPTQEIINYTVTFNTVDGSTITPQEVESGKLATKPSNPTKKGYTFNGWDFDFTTPITADITITAKWKKIVSSTETNSNKPSNPNNSNSTPVTVKYTVSFNSNGGSSVSSQTIVKDSKVTEPTNPTKSGYTFIAWQIDGSNYNFNTPITKDITLVAKWEKNASVYKITVTDIPGGIIQQSVIKLTIDGAASSFINVIADNTVIAEYNSSQSGAVGVKAVIDNYSTYTITLTGGATITIKR